MKKMLFWLTAVLCLWIAAGALAEGLESPYMENKWNFVENSMDVSQGIPPDAEGTLDKIRERGVLRVATEPYFPPQEFMDPSLTGQAQYVGADMELARLIAERMGVELEIVPLAFTDVLPAVMDGVCDLAISGLSFTPSRAQQVEMSKGYHYSDSVAGSVLLIRRDDRDSIRVIDDLWNKILVAQSGSLQEAMTAENIFKYKEFRRVPSMQDVYGMVQEGLADAAAVDMETAQTYIDSHPRYGLTLLENVQFSLEEQYQSDRVAGPKGDFELMYFVNGVIDEVLDSGLYQQWFDSYTLYAKQLEDAANVH